MVLPKYKFSGSLNPLKALFIGLPVHAYGGTIFKAKAMVAAKS